jgi:hypothetical protein
MKQLRLVFAPYGNIRRTELKVTKTWKLVCSMGVLLQGDAKQGVRARSRTLQAIYMRCFAAAPRCLQCRL